MTEISDASATCDRSVMDYVPVTSTGSPEETFALGEKIGRCLRGGEVILLYGGLGAGKTLLTKGILSSLDFDVDEVTSPSFALVNLYNTPQFDVYHLDLWRIEAGQNAAAAVGLYELLDNESAITIIEWADRLGEVSFADQWSITIVGDGDEARTVNISRSANT